MPAKGYTTPMRAARDLRGAQRFARRDRSRRAALPRRPPHRLRAWVGVRPRHARQTARQGARRGTSARLDHRRHEGRLEASVPVREGVGGGVRQPEVV